MHAMGGATGSVDCVDGCEDTGESCTQQCGHCLCSAHVGLLPDDRARLTTALRPLLSLSAPQSTTAQSGHLDPPFRPPVS